MDPFLYVFLCRQRAKNFACTSVTLLALHLSTLIDSPLRVWVSASGFMSASDCRPGRGRRHKSCIFAGRLIQHEGQPQNWINRCTEMSFGAASLITVQAALSSASLTPAPVPSVEPHTAYGVVKICLEDVCREASLDGVRLRGGLLNCYGIISWEVDICGVSFNRLLSLNVWRIHAQVLKLC